MYQKSSIVRFFSLWYSKNVKKKSFSFGKAIKILRSEADLTRQELAKRSQISYSYLTEIENEKKKPSTEILFKIARGLGIRPGTLVNILEEIANGLPVTPLKIAESRLNFSRQEPLFFAYKASSEKKEHLLEEIFFELKSLDEETLKILLQLIRRIKSK